LGVSELSGANRGSYGAQSSPGSPLEDRHAPPERGYALEALSGGCDGLLHEHDAIAPASAFRLVDVSGRRTANARELGLHCKKRVQTGNGARTAELRQGTRFGDVGIEDAHDQNPGRPKRERVHAAGGARSADGGP